MGFFLRVWGVGGGGLSLKQVEKIEESIEKEWVKWTSGKGKVNPADILRMDKYRKCVQV